MWRLVASPATRNILEGTDWLVAWVGPPLVMGYSCHGLGVDSVLSKVLYSVISGPAIWFYTHCAMQISYAMAKAHGGTVPSPVTGYSHQRCYLSVVGAGVRRHEVLPVSFREENALAPRVNNQGLL